MPVKKKKKGGQGEQRNSPRRIADHQRRMQGIAMKLAGATYDQIAQTLGYSGRQSAFRAINYELERHAEENVRELRKAELARLDAMQRAIWQRVVNGETEAINTALRITDRRLRIVPGLEAPRNYVVQEDNVHGAPEWIGKIITDLASDPSALQLAEQLGTLVASGMETHALLNGSDIVEGEVAGSETSHLPVESASGDGDQSEGETDRPDADPAW